MITIRSERVALPDGVRPAIVHVANGRVVAVGEYNDRPAGVRELDVGSFLVLPGLVDTHVHINEPGRTEWEGFAHATRAAAAGGVTTLVDMPLNSIPPTTTVAALEAKRAAARDQCHVDVGFWGGLVPGNVDHLSPLRDAGVLGFKCFLSPSGVDEFRHVTETDLRIALPVLAELGLPLLVHAELPSRLLDPLAFDDRSPPDPQRYSNWLYSRPPESEHEAIDLLIRLGREFGVAIHIVHLAAADALPMVSTARRDGISITVETCPHYLTFASEEIPAGATAFKCAPPIRQHQHREGLWQGLADREIDFVATDHSPSPPELKCLEEGDFLRAWGGIASLQLGLAAVWTGMLSRALPLERIAEWLSRGPARLAGLAQTKGAVAPGCDADLVIWDPDAITIIDGASLYHRHPITPYDGARLRGAVKTTILRGEVIFDEGDCRGGARGRLLRRA